MLSVSGAPADLFISGFSFCEWRPGSASIRRRLLRLREAGRGVTKGGLARPKSRPSRRGRLGSWSGEGGRLGNERFSCAGDRSVAQLASYRHQMWFYMQLGRHAPSSPSRRLRAAWRSADSATMSALVFPPNLEAGAAPTEPGSLPGAAPYTVRGTIAGALWRRRGFASTSRRSSQGDRRGHWPLLRL